MKRSVQAAVLPPIPDRPRTMIGAATVPRLPARMPRGTQEPPLVAPASGPTIMPRGAAPVPSLTVPRSATGSQPVPTPSPLPRTLMAPLHPYVMPPLPPSRRTITQPSVAPRGSVIPALSRCEVCSATVSELRRGRCWGCYARWVDDRPVGFGARCVTCGEQRRRVLKNVELFGAWRPMCFNCAGQLLHLDPLPPTIAAMRVTVSRERRGADRRVGKADTRVYQYERRVGDRRAGRALEAAAAQADDDLEIEIVVGPATDDGMDFEDLTSIRELVAELRPS